jgi:hypothetical protein
MDIWMKKKDRRVFFFTQISMRPRPPGDGPAVTRLPGNTKARPESRAGRPIAAGVIAKRSGGKAPIGLPAASARKLK